jgi:Spy/CpxP family protein refolding chaperone
MSVSKTRLLAAVALLVTFTAGIIIGVFGSHLVRLYHMNHGVPPGIADMMLNRLDRKLDLTPTQRTAVAAILHRHHQRINQLVTGVHPAIRQEIETANAEIQRVLTPEQRKKFEQLKIRMHGMAPHR